MSSRTLLNFSEGDLRVAAIEPVSWMKASEPEERIRERADSEREVEAT